MSAAPSLAVDADGWVDGAQRVPSPNFEARPAGAVPSLVVIHNISLPPGAFNGDAIVDLFLNRLDCDAHPYFDAHLRGVRVSSHFLIRRDGALLQFVSCDERAWHAGTSNFFGRVRCNDFSIGIELEGAIRSMRSPATPASRPSARPTPGRTSIGNVSLAMPASRPDTFPIGRIERAAF